MASGSGRSWQAHKWAFIAGTYGWVLIVAMSCPPRDAEKAAVGRANYILLAFGIASIVIMSMLMQHLMRVQKDNKQSPVAREVLSAFGGRMTGEPQLLVETNPAGPKAVLTVRALLGVDVERLARETGEYVWRRLGTQERLQTVVVKIVDEFDGGVTLREVASPLFTRGAASRPTSQVATSRSATGPASHDSVPPR